MRGGCGGRCGSRRPLLATRGIATCLSWSSLSPARRVQFLSHPLVTQSRKRGLGGPSSSASWVFPNTLPSVIQSQTKSHLKREYRKSPSPGIDPHKGNHPDGAALQQRLHASERGQTLPPAGCFRKQSFMGAQPVCAFLCCLRLILQQGRGRRSHLDHMTGRAQTRTVQLSWDH